MKLRLADLSRSFTSRRRDDSRFVEVTLGGEGVEGEKEEGQEEEVLEVEGIFLLLWFVPVSLEGGTTQFQLFESTSVRDALSSQDDDHLRR